jgi:hypothetical protein
VCAVSPTGLRPPPVLCCGLIAEAAGSGRQSAVSGDARSDDQIKLFHLTLPAERFLTARFGVATQEAIAQNDAERNNTAGNRRSHFDRHVFV